MILIFSLFVDSLLNNNMIQFVLRLKFVLFEKKCTETNIEISNNAIN